MATLDQIPTAVCLSPNDDAFTNIFSTPCPCQTLPSKTQRAGMFLQASYKFGQPGAVVAKD